jgi:4-hydroxy-tetrahydrodipicolinate synthase
MSNKFNGQVFTGLGTALVTPFNEDGSIAEKTFRELVERQIKGGVNFLVPCGTTGESPTLSRKEHLRVVEITLEIARPKGVPVLAGCGGYNTAEVIELGLELKALGVDGLLSITPYYNKPTQEGLVQHYKAMATALEMPIMVYSCQGRCGINVEPATLKRLSQIPGIFGVKEASGNMAQIARVIHEVPSSFIVLSGDDAVTIPLMSLGGKGIISVVANEVPKEMSSLVKAVQDGDYNLAREYQRFLLPLMDINFVESNPIPVKQALASMGLCQAVWRLPLTPPSPANKEKIEMILKEMKLI